MNTVWKFDIKPDDVIEIKLPAGALPLTVQEQHGNAQLWCLCDPKETVYEVRKFRLAGTGHPIQEDSLDLDYVGTFQLLQGSLVFHLFEILGG